MMFRRQDANEFGDSEWALVNGDGEDTRISIADLQEFGFGVYLDDTEIETADTLIRAKRIALELCGASPKSSGAPARRRGR